MELNDALSVFYSRKQLLVKISILILPFDFGGYEDRVLNYKFLFFLPPFCCLSLKLLRNYFSLYLWHCLVIILGFQISIIFTILWNQLFRFVMEWTTKNRFLCNSDCMFKHFIFDGDILVYCIFFPNCLSRKYGTNFNHFKK